MPVWATELTDQVMEKNLHMSFLKKMQSRNEENIRHVFSEDLHDAHWMVSPARISHHTHNRSRSPKHATEMIRPMK
jgi:hypothetical protein